MAKAQVSSKLPLVVIDLAHDDIPDDPKAVGNLRIVANADGGLNTPSGPTNDYVGRVAVERRGSTSQSLFPKVGYGFELRTADNRDTSATILGMPREEVWVLHGPYSDKTLIRNALAYGLGRKLMEYAPRTRYVELVLGGEYRGVYLLTERIKRDNDRVDISRLDADDLAGDSLTGGYIVKFDKATAERTGGFSLPAVDSRTPQSRLFYHYPKGENIAPAQADYIAATLADFERRLHAESFDDPELGYTAVADLASFVDFFLVNEVANNVDGFRLSTYLYKDRDDKGGKIKMGPVWDFNLAFGNAGYCRGDRTTGWMIYFADFCPGDGFQPPFWWPRLFESRLFREALVKRYTELREDGPLSNTAMLGTIDSLRNAIGSQATARNFERWPVIGEYVWPNPYVETSQSDAVRYLKSWTSDRLRWMDGAINAITLDTVTPLEPQAPVGIHPTYSVVGEARITGLTPEQFPVTITWYDTMGRALGTTQAGGPETLTTPLVGGVYVYYLTAADGTEASGRWVR